MTSSNTSERQMYKTLKEFEKKSILMTDENIFKEINNLDSLYKDEEFYQLNIDGILVNIGSKKRSVKLLTFAKKRLEKVLQDNRNDWFLYFFGNAEFQIANIKLSAPIADLISNKNLRKARDAYNSISLEKVLPQAYTNHANILEKYARNYEAIFLYDKALKFNPKFGMALGNKAIALLYYYDLAKKKNPDIIFQAKDLLKNAISLKNTEEVGGEVALKTFNKKYEEVCHIIEKYKLKRPTEKVMQNSKSDYIKFCMDKNIFLNYCFNCYQCEDGIKDNFNPLFLERINFLTDNKNYKFSSY
jgi:tetratricopeptide (TPR) repeat protein